MSVYTTALSVIPDTVIEIIRLHRIDHMPVLIMKNINS